METMDLTTAYRVCARITRHQARNFYFAFLSLPKPQRRAVYALYAFCREVDNVADLQANQLTEKHDKTAFLSGEGTDSRKEAEFVLRKRAGLTRLRQRLQSAAAGQPETLVDVAVADALEKFGVDHQDLADVITGVEMDLQPVAIQTFDELRTYCYHVASAVGLATLPILNAGIPPTDAMREAAIDLGLGMQLTNMLRDVAEDLDQGRIYLPAEELTRFGVSREDLLQRTMTPELRELFTFQYERANRLLADGRGLIPAIQSSGRGCLWLLSEIYGRILELIAASGFDVFAGRASLSTAEKLWLLTSILWRRL